MNCVSPPELDEVQLLAAIDGEADPRTAAHLAGCPYCRARADELAALQKNLTARLYRLACPSSLELGEYQLGMLEKLQAAAVAAHLRECPHCSLETARLTSYLDEPALSTQAGLLDGIRVLVARLAGDRSEGGPHAAGSFTPAFAMLRGGDQGPITLEADGILILLDIRPTAGGEATILGQVAAQEQDSWTGAQVELIQGDRPPLSARVDDLGAFRFEGVVPGPVELRITPESGVITIRADVEVVL